MPGVPGGATKRIKRREPYSEATGVGVGEAVVLAVADGVTVEGGEFVDDGDGFIRLTCIQSETTPDACTGNNGSSTSNCSSNRATPNPRRQS